MFILKSPLSEFIAHILENNCQDLIEKAVAYAHIQNLIFQVTHACLDLLILMVNVLSHHTNSIINVVVVLVVAGISVLCQNLLNTV